MFRELLAHPHEALHKRHLVYCVRIMSVGCATIAVKLFLNAAYLQPEYNLLHIYGSLKKKSSSLVFFEIIAL
jgi:hypothetical protein